MSELLGSVQCTVLHRGVPIGEVALPTGREWAGGLLTPTAGFAAVADVIANVRNTGKERGALVVLKARPGEFVATAKLTPTAMAAIEALLAEEFELRGVTGNVIATDFVRVADPGDGRGARVYAYFRGALAPTPAVVQPTTRRDVDRARGV